jgi:hypothetical protein
LAQREAEPPLKLAQSRVIALWNFAIWSPSLVPKAIVTSRQRAAVPASIAT